MKQIHKTLIAFLIFSIALGLNTLKAQESGWKYGNSISVGFPVDNMDNYSHSIGVYADFDYNFNEFLAARFDLGWNDFSGPERSWVDKSGIVHTDHPNMSLWEFSGGLRLRLAFFYIEGRGGYFTGINQWGVTPAAGLRFGKLDIQANYNIAGQYQWGGIRLAYYYGG